MLASEQIGPRPLVEEGGEPSRTCGRRLLVDRTKAGSPTLTAGFSDFLAQLATDGYAVPHFAGPSLGGADLANTDVVFIALPEQKYGATELAALESFVDGGCGLVFLAAFGTPPGETVAPDWFDACAELAAAFNVTIADLVGLPNGYVVDQSHLGAHPISQGLTNVGTYAFSLLPPGEPLLLTTASSPNPNAAIAVARTRGAGRFVIWSDSNALQNQHPGNYDNARFGRRAAAWVPNCDVP